MTDLLALAYAASCAIATLFFAVQDRPGTPWESVLVLLQGLGWPVVAALISIAAFPDHWDTFRRTTCRHEYAERDVFWQLVGLKGRVCIKCGAAERRSDS